MNNYVPTPTRETKWIAIPVTYNPAVYLLTLVSAYCLILHKIGCNTLVFSVIYSRQASLIRTSDWSVFMLTGFLIDRYVVSK